MKEAVGGLGEGARAAGGGSPPTTDSADAW